MVHDSVGPIDGISHTERQYSGTVMTHLDSFTSYHSKSKWVTILHGFMNTNSKLYVFTTCCSNLLIGEDDCRIDSFSPLLLFFPIPPEIQFDLFLYFGS